MIKNTDKKSKWFIFYTGESHLSSLSSPSGSRIRSGMERGAAWMPEMVWHKEKSESFGSGIEQVCWYVVRNAGCKPVFF
jgi:hypothetical protein